MTSAQDARKPGRFPFFQGILPLKSEQIPFEIIAGVTFAALAIPEVMGYTRIAGMPVVTGLYTILLPMAVFAIFGSSRHLVVGADSATAAILAGGLVMMVVPESPQYVAYAGMIALLAAVFLLLSALLKLGFIADFLSRTVLIGFLTGVGIQIAIGQLAGMFGMPAGSYGTLFKLPGFIADLSQTHIPTLALSLIIIGVIIITRTVSTRIPGAFVAVTGAIAASWAFNLSSYGITLIGTVPAGLPVIALPSVPLTELPGLISVAAACFVVILAQSAATSRAYALKFSETVDENKDLIGLGAANIAAGISGTFVVNGSPTKTEMVVSTNGRTQLAQIAAAAVVLAVLLFIAAPLAYLPVAVLSSVVFLIGLRLVDIRGMADLYRRRQVEFAVALITAVTVIVVGVGQGIAIAVVLSIIAHLRHSYRPLDSLLVPSQGGAMKIIPLADGRQAVEGLAIYRFGANLYFANESRFIEEVITLVRDARPPLKWLCLSASNIGDVDYTAAETLKQVHGELRKRGVTLVVSDLEEPVRQELDRDGITELIGRDHIFESVQDAIAMYQGLGKNGT
jgi:high affinity sulfate transporter 1